MSEPHVTITLGRSGQVVKKGGSKRSREKGGDGFSSSSKRHQGDGLKFSPGLEGANGSQIAQNDLRLKLMRKRLSKRIQNAVDEREKMQPFRKLSRPTQLPASSYRATHRIDHNASNLSRRVLPGDLHPVESLGKLYSSLTVGGSRDRSPERMWRHSSAMAPPRSFGSVRPAPADYPRYGQYIGAEVADAPRLTSLTPSTMKTTSAASKLVAPAAPTRGIVQKVPPMVEEPTTVTGFLNSLGLGKYAVLFQAEEVDMTVLKQMGDKDLKDMGIPMGPRKKILLSLLPPQKRQTPALHH